MTVFLEKLFLGLLSSSFQNLHFQKTDYSFVGYERHENSYTLQTIDDFGGVGEGGEMQESVDNL